MKNQCDKFTVLISLYEKENPLYLDACFNSIWFDQTHKPNEVVLVEDGPLTERLYRVLDHWTHEPGPVFKRVRLESNVGLGKALNEGLKYCSNDWIFRMDTDDICVPDRFERQLKFIRDNPDVSIFSGSILEFTESPDEPSGSKTLPLTHEDIIKYARWRCPFNHMAVAYKKSAIKAVGGYQHHLSMEDYNLWLRVLAAGYKAGNLPDTLVYVRAGDAMVARRRGWAYMKSEWKLFRLKRELHFQALVPAFTCFLFRASMRMLPVTILRRIYSLLRKWYQ